MSRDEIRVVAAVIEQDGRYLITQRNAAAVLPLLWEFPGGRVEPGESDEEALIREVRGRIGIDVVIDGKIGEHHHTYSHYDVHLTMYACTIEDGIHPRPVNVNDLRWVRSAELRDYEFPPADENTMDKLLGLMSN
ncbi:MAG: (deoxy)nucleoside triphosphate pyrophosphohydrolase [Proteobacteria bacterium]|nr:(deoxy)nucleoside triphosphate pyrophosphohydrolase [Pseudomonadota bacterium]